MATSLPLPVVTVIGTSARDPPVIVRKSSSPARRSTDAEWKLPDAKRRVPLLPPRSTTTESSAVKSMVIWSAAFVPLMVRTSSTTTAAAREGVACAGSAAQCRGRHDRGRRRRGRGPSV